jgi:hypothetical protein
LEFPSVDKNAHASGLTATAGYIDMIRVDIIAIGVSSRGGAQPRTVHATVLVFAAGIAL